MKLIKDKTGYEIGKNKGHKRIVSLVPSLTELVFALGLDDKIVAVSDYCVHPSVKTVTLPKVGGPKKVDMEKIKSFEPDLILASKEENSKQQIDELRKTCSVYVADVKGIDDALRMITEIGQITGKDDNAQKMMAQIKEGFSLLTFNNKIPVVYLIWEKPYMVAGGGTFINEMLEAAGFKNVFAQAGRYPKVTARQLRECGAEFFFLSSEPYHFGTEHIMHFRALCSCTKVLLVDGEMFGWYGSHMLKATAYLRTLRSVVTAMQKSY